MATLSLSSPHFPSAQLSHIFSARPGNPLSFIVAGADEVTEMVLLAAVHMSLPGTTSAERIARTFRGQPVRRLHHYPR
jgi:hypothetical protein